MNKRDEERHAKLLLDLLETPYLCIKCPASMNTDCNSFQRYCRLICRTFIGLSPLSIQCPATSSAPTRLVKGRG